MGGVYFATVATILVKLSSVGRSESMFVGPLVVVGTGPSGVNKDILCIVVFKGHKLVDF